MGRVPGGTVCWLPSGRVTFKLLMRTLHSSVADREKRGWFQTGFWPGRSSAVFAKRSVGGWRSAISDQLSAPEEVLPNEVSLAESQELLAKLMSGRKHLEKQSDVFG